MPNKINADWHASHPMPKNPSMQQRVDWHVVHARACACRPMPASVKAAMKGSLEESDRATTTGTGRPTHDDT